MADIGDPHDPDASPDSSTGAPSIPEGVATQVRHALPPSGHGSEIGAHAHDDLIGFTSPASLKGSPWSAPEPAITPPSRPDTAMEPSQADDAPDLFDDLPLAPAPVAASTTPPDVEAPSLPTPLSARVPPRPNTTPETPGLGTPASPVERIPAWAVETAKIIPAPKSTGAYFGRADRADASPDRDTRPEGAMSLYTVYALILFAVPTLGLAALIGLVAIHGRRRPTQAFALSHSTFQARTLWISAIAAVIGAAMIAVNLGVFVLFFVAVWVLLRGAFGLLRLASGRSIANPRGWWL